jgi:hypothetical protein
MYPQIVTEDGLMRPVHQIRAGGLYCGGSARQIEAALGFSGEAFFLLFQSFLFCLGSYWGSRVSVLNFIFLAFLSYPFNLYLCLH